MKIDKIGNGSDFVAMSACLRGIFELDRDSVTCYTLSNDRDGCYGSRKRAFFFLFFGRVQMK
jgi:hypothetical protein